MDGGGGDFSNLNFGTFPIILPNICYFLYSCCMCAKYILMEVLRGAGENISSSKGTQPKIVSSGPGKLAKIFRILARIFSHIGPGPPPGWPPPAEK